MIGARIRYGTGRGHVKWEELPAPARNVQDEITAGALALECLIDEHGSDEQARTLLVQLTARLREICRG